MADAFAGWEPDRLEYIGSEVCDTAVRTFQFAEQPDSTARSSAKH